MICFLMISKGLYHVKGYNYLIYFETYIIKNSFSTFFAVLFYLYFADLYIIFLAVFCNFIMHVLCCCYSIKKLMSSSCKSFRKTPKRHGLRFIVSLFIN